MEHCPSAVPHARTEVRDIPGGVELTVRAPDDAFAQQEIRRRVQFQMQISEQPERGSIEHTGMGTGSGDLGFCPGMNAGTSLEVSWLGDGATLTIKADKPGDVKRLQKSTHKRAKALAARASKTAAR